MFRFVALCCLLTVASSLTYACPESDPDCYEVKPLNNDLGDMNAGVIACEPDDPDCDNALLPRWSLACDRSGDDCRVPARCLACDQNDPDCSPCEKDDPDCLACPANDPDCRVINVQIACESSDPGRDDYVFPRWILSCSSSGDDCRLPESGRSCNADDPDCLACPASDPECRAIDVLIAFVEEGGREGDC